MSRAHSISTRRPFGMSRVCRIWGVSRATLYRFGAVEAATSVRTPKRRGPTGGCSDAELLIHIKAVIAASPFFGEGYRKVWARLRVQGVKTAERRVRRIMKENKHRLVSAVALMMAGMLVIGLWPSFHPRVLAPRGVAEVPDGYRELRVMSFNVWLWNRDQDAIRNQIELQDPDIVFFAEVNRYTREMADSMLDTFPYQYPTMLSYGFHLRIMSRYPLSDVTVRGPWKGPVFARVSLGPQWGNLTILGTHTIRAPQVNAQWVQVTTLADYVQTIPAPRLVVGDFNATPYSRMVRTFAARSGLKKRTSIPTWPASNWRLPQLAIDHMFADRELLFPDGVQAGEMAGSDHLPIVARVLVPVPGRAAALQQE